MPRRVFPLVLLGLAVLCAAPLALPAQTDEMAFRALLGRTADTAEKDHAAAVEGLAGWFFLTAELRMMSVGRFWGEYAVKVSHAPKPETADPLPAILDFNRQLKDRGISLLVVPVPPKAEIYPEEVSSAQPPAGDPDFALGQFYDELRKSGVDVLDLAGIFRANKAGEHGPVFCKTDTHWSGAGCVLAAQAIAKDVLTKITVQPPTRLDPPRASEWKEISIDGDLGSMLDAGAKKPGAEKVFVRQLKDAVTPNPDSSVLLLGDSHTLVFHDFLSERAGLLDQLAVELGSVPDRIGVRGSGATAVRIDLYRRGIKEPGYLAKKKVVIWCFTAREFTEAAQGWQKLPVAK